MSYKELNKAESVKYIPEEKTIKVVRQIGLIYINIEMTRGELLQLIEKYGAILYDELENLDQILLVVDEEGSYIIKTQ